MVLENHGCGPVCLQSGQTLGHVEEYQQERVQDCDGIGESQATVNTLLVETEHTAPEAAEDLHVDKQKRLMKIMESLIIHKSNLSSEQVTLLMNLVEEYSDIFALDATELGSTNLVTHSIDTGDSPPICQSVRRVPFALHMKMEQLVQEMMDQGVIQHSSSPWASPMVLVKKKDGSHHFCVTHRGGWHSGDWRYRRWI